MISYAQNFEDVLLNRVFKDRTNGFYLDVGAMDPVQDSVTKWFYDQGWNGVNIEPNPWFYEKLLSDRPRDINLNVALGVDQGEKLFHVFEQYGVSTFDESTRDRYVDQGFEVKEKTVRVMTLADVCQKYATRPIDFLKVDCEGWEKPVLEGADWDRFRPTVLIVEATEPGTTNPSWEEWEPVLIEARYDIVYFDGLNRYYLRRESADLRRHFEIPPNVFDEIQLFATYSAQEANREMLGELQNLQSRLQVLDNTVSGLTGENARLTETVRGCEAELSHLRAQTAMDKGQISRLETERAELFHLSEVLQQRTTQQEEQLRGFKERTAELEQKLRESRLWVGRLRQDLVASKVSNHRQN